MSKCVNATVDVTHSNILNKLDIIKECISLITNPTHITSLCSSIESDYDNVMPILLKYYSDNSTSQQYFSFIDNENIVSRINQCMLYITSDIDGSKHSTRIQRYVNVFNRTPIVDVGYHTFVYEYCECGGKMNVAVNNNEYICHSCGTVTTVYNDNTDGYGGYSDKSNRIGNYDPSRRCKFWVDRIQGCENTDIPPECITAVTHCIHRDNLKNNTIILCVQIREYLKETGFSAYNDNVVLIRKIITNYTPPALTDTELHILSHIFNKVITIFDDVKANDKSNSPYYPYLVGKILHSVLPPGIRRRRILECIHMQSNTTLIANDKLMKKICKHIPEIKYIPTIKSEFTIFR